MNNMHPAKIEMTSYADGVLTLTVSGCWKLQDAVPSAEDVVQFIAAHKDIRGILLKAGSLETWDSSLLTSLLEILRAAKRRKIPVDSEHLPEGIRQLITLATAVPRKEDARKSVYREPLLSKIGDDALAFIQSAGELLAFIGSAFMAFVKVITGKGRMRPVDLWIFLQNTGIQAVPIVSLISFLVGLILAFVGVMQLKLFGAQIYVADLVGIAMVREMGAIMTGIIMAGRTGAAFAAQIGTMQVNEEIDALETLAIPPMEFLVIPRMLALTLMMPLLVMYANIMGVFGGALVASGLYDIGLTVYINRTIAAVGLNDLFVGLFMSAVFGVLVALSGCLRGMQCGRSASAVGDAATSAVVTGIVSLIVATAIITIATSILGI
jgi:phospholipid/cholesterol/gamma-HCH transport system permease protein